MGSPESPKPAKPDVVKEGADKPNPVGDRLFAKMDASMSRFGLAIGTGSQKLVDTVATSVVYNAKTAASEVLGTPEMQEHLNRAGDVMAAYAEAASADPGNAKLMDIHQKAFGKILMTANNYPVSFPNLVTKLLPEMKQLDEDIARFTGSPKATAAMQQAKAYLQRIRDAFNGTPLEKSAYFADEKQRKVSPETQKTRDDLRTAGRVVGLVLCGGMAAFIAIVSKLGTPKGHEVNYNAALCWLVPTLWFAKGKELIASGSDALYAQVQFLGNPQFRNLMKREDYASKRALWSQFAQNFYTSDLKSTSNKLLRLHAKPASPERDQQMEALLASISPPELKEDVRKGLADGNFNLMVKSLEQASSESARQYAVMTLAQPVA